MYLAAAATKSSNGSLWLIILIVLGGGYLLFIRSVQRKQRARAADAQNMRTAVDVGSEIVTIGGLYATVVGGDDDSVMLEIADGVTVRYDRAAVARVVTLADSVDPDASDENDADADLVSSDSTDGTDLDTTAHSIIDSKD